jgi:hypothetical protein
MFRWVDFQLVNEMVASHFSSFWGFAFLKHAGVAGVVELLASYTILFYLI